MNHVGLIVVHGLGGTSFNSKPFYKKHTCIYIVYFVRWAFHNFCYCSYFMVLFSLCYLFLFDFNSQPFYKKNLHVSIYSIHFFHTIASLDIHTYINKIFVNAIRGKCSAYTSNGLKKSVTTLCTVYTHIVIWATHMAWQQFTQL